VFGPLISISSQPNELWPRLAPRKPGAKCVPQSLNPLYYTPIRLHNAHPRARVHHLHRASDGVLGTGEGQTNLHMTIEVSKAAKHPNSTAGDPPKGRSKGTVVGSPGSKSAVKAGAGVMPTFPQRGRPVQRENHLHNNNGVGKPISLAGPCDTMHRPTTSGGLVPS
jgi:hypothetical protein